MPIRLRQLRRHVREERREVGGQEVARRGHRQGMLRRRRREIIVERPLRPRRLVHGAPALLRAIMHVESARRGRRRKRRCETCAVTAQGRADARAQIVKVRGRMADLSHPAWP